MELLLATNNVNKKREYEEILSLHHILLPSDIGLDFDFDETGSTYFENAFGKGMTLFRQVRKPVIADDSGLSVPALGGAPGLYSSRYGAPQKGDKLPAPERNKYLLRKMEHIEDRRAFFVCCFVLILEAYRFFSVQETLKGAISREPAGTGGFGYDPIFFLPAYGKTVAELPAETKHSLSHRGKAGKRMAALMHNTLERI
jgi:XTP/dITP diphosphohydrolase